MTLELSEKRIINCLSVPVQVIDRDYKIIFMNESARAHHGADPEPIGKPCYAVSHGLDHPCWKNDDIECPVKSVFETGKRERSFHKHRYMGQVIVEEIIATALREDGEGVELVVEEFRDVTKLLELREGVLPICANCKRIRGTEGQWHMLEAYFCHHTGADFSHSLCPECLKELYPDLEE